MDKAISNPDLTPDSREQKTYRYILIPFTKEVLEGMVDINVPFLVVVPEYKDWDAWSKKWLKANANSETIISRMTAWEALIPATFKNRFAITLSKDEWLGNILSQDPQAITKE